MTDQLDLSLPKPDAPSGGMPRVPLLLGLVLLVGIANLFLAARSRSSDGPTTGGLAPDARQQLALELEKRDLFRAASEEWQGYLATATDLGPEERAKVWYRVGTLRQRAGEHEQALAAFLRSESLATLEGLDMEIRRRSQQCLEALGRFGAVRRDLASRVGDGTDTSSSEVVAEIGGEKITNADLDRLIEEEITRQIDQFGGQMTPEQQKKQKEELLKRLSAPQERLRFLSNHIGQELLYRRARQDGLAEEPETRKMLANIERDVLARRVLETEFKRDIRITDGDVKTFYEANKPRFLRPERAQISVILVKERKDADDVLAKLKGGSKFGELARTLSLDTSTKDKGGAVEGWVHKGSPLPGVEDSAAAYAAIFATEAGKVAQTPLKTEKGYLVVQVREREPERQMPFEEVRSQAARALYAQKEREVNARLMQELYETHNVVVHQSKFQKPTTPQPDDEKKK
jgi:parvulin-like peptidyl-prolyl isomerase